MSTSSPPPHFPTPHSERKESKTCETCTAPFNQTYHAPLPCLKCGYTVGQRCWQQWVLMCVEEKHQIEIKCMSCGHRKPPTFVYSMGGKSWRDKYFAKYRSTILNREREALAQLAPFLEQRRQIVALNAQIKDRDPKFQEYVVSLSSWLSERPFPRDLHVIYVKNLRKAILFFKNDSTVSLIDNPRLHLDISSDIYKLCRSAFRHLVANHNDVDLLQILYHSDRNMNLYHPSSSSTLATSSSSETKSDLQKMVLCKCPSEQCLGLIYKGTPKCMLCTQRVCCHCLEALLDNETGSGTTKQHACNPDTLATIQVIREGSRNCPRCGTSIYKVDPTTTCNDMFCFHCKTAFNFRTLEIDLRGNTNPESQRWLHSREYMQRREGMERHNDDDEDVENGNVELRFGTRWGGLPCIQRPPMSSDQPVTVRDLEIQFVSVMSRYVFCHQSLFEDKWDFPYPGNAFLCRADMNQVEEAVSTMRDFRTLAMHLERQTRKTFKNLEHVAYKQYTLRMRYLEGAISRDAFQKQTLLFERRYQVELEYDQVLERTIQVLEDTANEFRRVHARLYFDRVREAIRSLRSFISESTWDKIADGMDKREDGFEVEITFGEATHPIMNTKLASLGLHGPNTGGEYFWRPTKSTQKDEDSLALQTMAVLSRNHTHWGFHDTVFGNAFSYDMDSPVAYGEMRININGSTLGLHLVDLFRMADRMGTQHGEREELSLTMHKFRHFYFLDQDWEIIPILKCYEPPSQDLSTFLTCVSKSHTAIEQCNESLRAISAEHAVPVRFQLVPTLSKTDLLYREQSTTVKKSKAVRRTAHKEEEDSDSMSVSSVSSSSSSPEDRPVSKRIRLTKQ